MNGASGAFAAGVCALVGGGKFPHCNSSLNTAGDTYAAWRARSRACGGGAMASPRHRTDGEVRLCMAVYRYVPDLPLPAISSVPHTASTRKSRIAPEDAALGAGRIVARFTLPTARTSRLRPLRHV